MKNIGFSKAEMARQERIVALLVAATGSYHYNDIRQRPALHRRYSWYCRPRTLNILVNESKKLGLTFTIDREHRSGSDKFMLQFFPDGKPTVKVKAPKKKVSKKLVTWQALERAPMGTFVLIEKLGKRSLVMKNEKYSNLYIAKNNKAVSVNAEDVVKITNIVNKIKWPSIKAVA